MTKPIITTATATPDFADTTGTDGASTKPEFRIDSAEKADWLLRKLLHIDAEKATIEAMAAQRVKELEADRAQLLARFGSELEAWARGEAETRRRQTVTLSYGSVSFRKVPARLTITSEADALTTARAVLPQAIRTETRELFDKDAYLAHAKATLESTGELLPGIETTEERTSFSIKPGGSKKAPTDTRESA